MNTFYTLRAIAALGTFVVLLWTPACKSSSH
jgi:hypothetical protein